MITEVLNPTIAVYLGGYDISAALDASVLRMAVETERSRGTGRLVAHRRHDVLDHAGWFNVKTRCLDVVMEALLGASAPLAFVVGPRQGGIAYISSEVRMEHPHHLSSRAGALVRAWNRFVPSVPFERSVVLQPKVCRNDPGWSEALDEGASSTVGGQGYVFCFDASGGATVTLEDSSDNVRYRQMAPFLALAGIGAWRMAVDGAVGRFVRTRLTPAEGATVTYAVLWQRR